jgi:glutamate dehydrogenase (NAD(P)+)
MNWIKDTYETLENTTAPGVITGKAPDNGGSAGRVEATGRSVMFASREVFDYLDRDLADATVAVQGYGNAGWIAAKLIEQQGATVVAVSDSSGAIHDPDGLDTVAVKEFKRETGSVSGYDGATAEFSNRELLTMDVDLLVPAALENAIDGDIAPDVRADVIVEAANGPLTPAADDVISESDTYVVPDILANAGGVTVSYFEWVQNRQRFYWTEERVNEELERHITNGFDDLIDAYESSDAPDLRTAACVVAIQRVVAAYENRAKAEIDDLDGGGGGGDDGNVRESVDIDDIFGNIAVTEPEDIDAPISELRKEIEGLLDQDGEVEVRFR